MIKSQNTRLTDRPTNRSFPYYGVQGLKGRLLAFAVFACVSVSLAIGAQAHSKTPLEQVRTVLDKISGILESSEPDSHTKTDMVRTTIAENFDEKRMARNSLGDTWAELSNERRQEFVDSFRDLFLDSYTRLVLNFLKREELDVRGESVTGNTAKVGTAIRRANDEIPVDYYLEKIGDRWFITEVDIDGVGIVKSYKTAFHRVIKRDSFDGLLEKLNAQRAALKRKES
jgi:phospholipid transport system substrate-binding protein